MNGFHYINQKVESVVFSIEMRVARLYLNLEKDVMRLMSLVQIHALRLFFVIGNSVTSLKL